MKALAALLLLGAATAHADHPINRPEAIDVDRDMTPPGRGEFGFDGGGEVGTFALSLGGSVVVDARMPLSHQTGARYAGFGDDRPLDRWVAGDLALGARIRVFRGDRFGAFLRTAATFGTGNDYQFAGEARYTLSWLLVGRAKLPHDIVLAATGGIRLRGAEVQVADRLAGDEFLGGVGATVPIPGCLRLEGEIVGALGDDVAKKRGPSPAEARIGVIAHPRDYFAFAVRIGGHIDDQIGAPRFRAMLELIYTGPPVVERHREAPRDDDEEDDDDQAIRTRSRNADQAAARAIVPSSSSSRTCTHAG